MTKIIVAVANLFVAMKLSIEEKSKHSLNAIASK